MRIAAGRSSTLARLVATWPAGSLAAICGTTVGAQSGALLAEGVVAPLRQRRAQKG